MSHPFWKSCHDCNSGVSLNQCFLKQPPPFEQKVSTGNCGPDLKRFEPCLSVALVRNTPNVKKAVLRSYHAFYDAFLKCTNIKKIK